MLTRVGNVESVVREVDLKLVLLLCQRVAHSLH